MKAAVIDQIEGRGRWGLANANRNMAPANLGAADIGPKQLYPVIVLVYIQISFRAWRSHSADASPAAFDTARRGSSTKCNQLVAFNMKLH
jgi:hypothetical protein